MPEHVHLLFKPAKDDYSVSKFLTSVKGSVVAKALDFRRKSSLPESAWEPFLDLDPKGGVTFRFWQRGGGYDRNLRKPEDILEKLNYMHDNPVSRGLCTEAVTWRWSSAGFYSGIDDGPLQVDRVDF